LPLSGGTMTGAINAGAFKIGNIADGVANSDAASVGQMNTAIGTAVGAYVKKDGSVQMTADWNFGGAGNSFKITNLHDPAAAQDAATKNYVDTVAGAYL